MTIQWHLTTGPTIDVLQLSGYLGDDAVTRFHGAVGWALVRGERILLVDCTQLNGWSPAGRSAVATAATNLVERGRTLELVCPPEPVDAVPAHVDLSTARTHHSAASDAPASDAWHTSRWNPDAGS